MGAASPKEEMGGDISWIKNYCTQISHRFPNTAGTVRLEVINNLCLFY
jgi:hypothetical protein